MRYTYRHTGQHGSACSERFESEQRMSEEAYEKCPKCGYAVERVIFAGQRPIGGGTPIHHG